ncbi:MAG: IclR family transcriptional regulator C-terminal domain-containing protein [Succinivibrio sp.]|jgi:DNA-binding IclR family transcriptional regulator|nr:IclR family transcriptional regulator C-terminal domain-containing protein [Succinivibrio sp.]
MSKSICKAVKIIRCLSENPAGRGVTEVAKETGFGKSSVHEMLSTLCEEGVLCQDPRSRRYALSAHFLWLGYDVACMLRPDRAVLTELAAMRGELGMSTGMWIAQKDLAVCVAASLVSSDDDLLSGTGRHDKLWTTAAGQVLLTSFEGEELEKLLPEDAGERGRIMTLIDQTRRRGYGSDRGEIRSGTCSVAVPVYNKFGRLKAALSVRGPMAYFAGGAPEKFARRLVRASAVAMEHIDG